MVAEIASYTGLRCDFKTTPEMFVDSQIAMNLTLIVNELIANAKKYAYADESGGRLDVSCLTNGDGHLHLNVKDYGPGLPANFSLEKSTGLGISIIQSIVQQLRGTIAAQSARGACFKITIPFSQREAISQ